MKLTFAKSRDIITVFLSVLAIILSIYTLYTTNKLSREGLDISATYYPEIDVKLSRLGDFFPDFDLKKQYRVLNHSGLFLEEKKIGVIYINRGQSNSNVVMFSLRDEYYNYSPVYGYPANVVNIDALKAGEVNFEVSHPNCRPTSVESEVKEVRKICQDTQIPGGLIKWILKVDCPTCRNRQKCYSFYTCLTNSTYTAFNCDKENENWEQDLKKLEECPSERPYVVLGESQRF